MSHTTSGLRRRALGLVFFLVVALVRWSARSPCTTRRSPSRRDGRPAHRHVGNALPLNADVKVRGVIVGEVRSADPDGAKVEPEPGAEPPTRRSRSRPTSPRGCCPRRCSVNAMCPRRSRGPSRAADRRPATRCVRTRAATPSRSARCSTTAAAAAGDPAAGPGEDARRLVAGAERPRRRARADLDRLERRSSASSTPKCRTARGSCAGWRTFPRPTPRRRPSWSDALDNLRTTQHDDREAGDQRSPRCCVARPDGRRRPRELPARPTATNRSSDRRRFA